MKIIIDKKLKEITPQFNVGVLECNVEIYEEKEVDFMINELETKIEKTIDILEVVNLKTILEGRNAYKKYGKDPSRYRLAVESLYRRLSKGNPLYRINNVVDIGNVISLKSRRSVAVLDYHKIIGDVNIRLGVKEDDFIGIGRGKINIENIPLYADNVGPFGSTTTDTDRTMITSLTKKILLFIISFTGEENLKNQLGCSIDFYRKYAKGKNFNSYIL